MPEKLEINTSIQFQLLSFEHIATKCLSNHISCVGPTDDSNGPLLPFPIPVQRNRYSPKPSAYKSSNRTSKYLISRTLCGNNLDPFKRVEAMYVEEGKDGEESDMRRGEGCVKEMGRQRSAAEDLKGGEDRDGESCGGKGDENILCFSAMGSRNCSG